jgi:prephenate dehydrogenase
MSSSLPCLGVVGTGLIGTSVALAARHGGWDVVLRDADSHHCQLAVESGAGREWVEGDSPDIVLVAVPPAETGLVVCEMIRLYPDATVMDTASTKYNVVVQVKSSGLSTDRFVPSHPMAGREISGPRGAAPDLFADRVWVTCPGAGRGATTLARRLIEVTGAVGLEMAPDVHDRAVATTSHAAQVLSSALAARLTSLTPEEVRISGQGLRDATRLAASDPTLWQQILHSNAREVAVALRAIGSDINAVAKELERLSDESVHLLTDMSTIDLPVTAELLVRGRNGQARIPGRHGAGRERLAMVAVQLEDRPGALAELFVVAGDMDINLLDVRIDHLWGRPSGLVELSVDPRDEDPLRAGLRSRQFDVRA